MAIQIDPKTGERIEDAPQIDPATGERVTAAPIVAGAGALGLPQPGPAPLPNMAKYAGNLETIPSGSDPGLIGGAKTAVHNFGARVGNNLNALAAPVLHPIQTGSAILQRGAFPVTPAAIKAASYNPSGPDAGATAENVLGDVATGFLTHQAAPVAGAAAENVGEGMQGKGVKLINNTVGALASDFKRGTNPGRGYFDAGMGPSSSLRSIANKAAAAKDASGADIGAAVENATKSGITIPPTSVAQRLQPPLTKAFDLENGPGGTGNTAQLENYSAGFRPAIQDATQNGGFTPQGLFDLKKNIAANTNWSDPTQFNLKSVRQQQTGALSGLLGDVVPEVKPLNQNYADLGKLANRAGSRADTGSMPLTKLGKLGAASLLMGGAGFEQHGPTGLAAAALPIIADSVPARTTAASGLFYGGKGLAAAGTKVRGLFGK